MMNKFSGEDVDAYIAMFTPEVREKLELIRQTISAAAPDAEETISYQMPAFKLDNRVLVYFAACKKHIGFYPASSGITAFREQISSYQSSKGAVQFPLDEPPPLALITEMVRFRVKEYLKRKEINNVSIG